MQFDGKPVIRMKYALSGSAVNYLGEKIDLQSLTPGRIGAFAGVADPDSFFSALESSGVYPNETLSFVDHVDYGTIERSRLHGVASRCDVLLTTEKDLVKLHDIQLPCDCLAVPLEIVPNNEDKDLLGLVDKFFDQYKERFMLSEQLIDLLACPKCKGEVKCEEDQGRVLCEPCKLAYPVRDGIPVMLEDEAEKLS
jgi:uncharacterized protein YbaR (Trm112 family)